MFEGEPQFLCLTGPTTSGKTDLSLHLAEHLGGEVVSMDSRQVYRGMDIGTDKVSLGDRARVPHHGLDLVDPGERYSAGRFARDARRWIQDIRARGKVPILTGGTGFFLRAVMEPIFREPEMDPIRLGRLRALLDKTPIQDLSRWVGRLDPVRADLARAGGRQRLGRTVEVALMTGRPLSWWHQHAGADGPALGGVVVVLTLPRERLDTNISNRVTKMVERGLVEEVQALLGAGYTTDAPGMTGTGYREIAQYLDGRTSLENALDQMNRQTRRYARRQLTWFRGQIPNAPRIDAQESVDEKVARISSLWRSALADGRPPVRSNNAEDSEGMTG